MSGRPLRFLGAVLGGWTVARLAVLWPTIDSLPSLAKALIPPVAAATLPPALAHGSAVEAAPEPTSPTPAAAQKIAESPSDSAVRTPTTRESRRPDPPPSPSTPRQPPPLRPAPLARPPDRLAASAWLILRGGQGGTLTGGQLGASQLGARLTYALGHRIALAARVSAPLHGRGRELALGVDWQPTAMPVHVIAEQRLSLDGGRGGPTLLVTGGVDPTPVGLGFSVDAYAQAGGIARDGRVEGFADGAMRVARPVLRVASTRLELGAGAWGGAQRGAARLDVGPSAALVLPVGGRSVRVALDWRQRVAGQARPGSGAALSIGSDF